MNARAGRLLVAGIAVSQLAACATNPTETVNESVRSAAAIESPPNRLAALAELEAFDPVTTDLSEAIALIDPSFPRALDQGSEVYRRAVRPLDGLLDEFPVLAPAGELEPVDTRLQAQAAKLYARARLARKNDDPGQSVTLMEQAVRIDPNSPELWRELGEASYATGDRIGAVEALRFAAELGETNDRVLMLLASDAGSRGENGEVIRWAGALIGQEANGANAGNRAIAGAMLGTALTDRGNLRAGADSLQSAMDELDSLTPAPGESTEVTRLRVRRGEMFARIGDAWAALGETAQAEMAYARAGADGRGDPVAITQRVLASKVASGRPADAALTLLDHLGSNAGDLGPEEAQWVRGIATIDHVGDAMLDASEDIIGSAELPASARRQVLRAIVRGETDSDRAIRRVRDSGSLGRSPVVIGDALWRLDREDRTRACVAAVAAEPRNARAFGAALSRLVPEPAALAGELGASDDPAARALALGVALEIRSPALVRGVIESGPNDSTDPTLGAELCGIAGWWSLTNPWLTAAKTLADENPDTRARSIGALNACQRLGEAERLAAAIDDDPDASVDDLLSAGEVAFAIGDSAGLESRIARAAVLDPFDERVWERRITLATARAEDDPGESLRDAGRALAESRPRSALFALLRARELGSQGRMGDAADLIMAVGEREPSRDLGLSLLVQAASAARRQQPGSGVVERAGEWLLLRHESVPGSVAGFVALAQIDALGDPGLAIESLDGAEEGFGHPEIARSAERILLTMDAGESAVRRVMSRTAQTTSIEHLLERAEAARVLGESAAVIAALRAALPEGGRLTQSQRQRWQVQLLALAQTTDGDGLDEGVANGVLGLLDAADGRSMPMPDPLVRARVILLARTGQTDRLGALVDSMDLNEENGLMVVQALLASGQRAQGLDLLARLAVGTDDDSAINEELIEEWTRLVGAGGDARGMRTMLGLLGSPERARTVADLLRERFQLSTNPGEPSEERDRADIAYAGALIATVFERPQEAAGMYRVCLSHDPDHAWACNDLGYALADRDESLEEAERLVQRAYELIGPEASVTDSLGWARYKLGVLEDETDAEGNVVRKGAVSLLTGASRMEDGQGNSTIFLHLGDALWRVGRRDDALAAWSEAETQLRSSAIDNASLETPNQRRADMLAEALGEVRRRLGDAENGQEPTTARIPSLDDGLGDAGGDESIN